MSVVIHILSILLFASMIWCFVDGKKQREKYTDRTYLWTPVEDEGIRRKLEYCLQRGMMRKDETR